MNWYAVYTRPKWEKKVASLLEEEGIECYCPLNKVLRQWSDRKKIILEPVFKTYVFVKVEEAKKWDLKKIPGILNFVYWLGKPAPIKDQDILTIRRFLNEFKDVQVEQQLQLNEKVKIKQGALMDYKGILVEMSGTKVRVRIESMGLTLSAVVEKKNVEKINP